MFMLRNPGFRKIAVGIILPIALCSGGAGNSRQPCPEAPGEQISPGRKAPSITMLPAPIMNVTRGKANTVSLKFRIGSGFHVNSNHPKSEFLIPTVLKLNPPTDIMIGGVDLSGGRRDEFCLCSRR